jgi:CheY-like chemotaxis protein
MARETILVADDDRVVVELLSLWLEAHGFTVARAADGMQVIMMVRRAPPAAILLDLMMPGGTGFDVLTRLHSNAAMKSIPVIAMSASVDPDLPHKALQSGADAFLYKPVEQEELLATIRGVLEKRKGPSKENS